MDVGLIAAFFGGALALLSPCGALLVPAFFAALTGSKTRLIMHTAVFYLGLLLVLAPLGVASGTIGAIFTAHRSTVIVVTSLLLVLLGVVQIIAGGFDLARFLPAANRLPEHAAARRGLPRTAALGAASGLVGACTGPILGAVLTLAAARGDAVAAVLLLAVYGAGMVVPLVVIALGWNRFAGPLRERLHRRTVTIAGRKMQPVSLVTGVVLIILGAVFWTTNGLVTMPELLSAQTQLRLQETIGRLTGTWLDVAVVTAVGATILVVWARRRRAGTRDPGR